MARQPAKAKTPARAAPAKAAAPRKVSVNVSKPVVPKAARDPRGRPSKYYPEICDQLVEFCRTGYSISAFCGELLMPRSTLVKWSEQHPELLQALEAAKLGCARWWEQRGRQIGNGQSNSAAATMTTFYLKNMAEKDFVDKQNISTEGTLTIKIGEEFGDV